MVNHSVQQSETGTLPDWPIRPGLSRIQTLLELWNVPLTEQKYVIIGGTNGKGTVAYLLHTLLTSSGIRTGLFTSPHIHHETERIRIREPVDPQHLNRLKKELEHLLHTLPTDHQPTYFEKVTALALKYFIQENVECAILEVGLGGRFDATNIVHPILTIITGIDYDHTQFLGHTLKKIAYEKFGISRENVPLFLGEEKPHILQCFDQWANLKGVPLRYWYEAREDVERVFSSPELREKGQLHLYPDRSMKKNIALAWLAYQELKNVLGFSQHAQLELVLQNFVLPCRLEMWGTEENDRVFLLDGAHNLSALRRILRVLKKERWIPDVILFSAFRDKPIIFMLHSFLSVTKTIFMCPIEGSPRTFSVRDLRLLVKGRSYIHIFNTLTQALEEVFHSKLKRVLVCGSFYLCASVQAELVKRGYHRLKPGRI